MKSNLLIIGETYIIDAEFNNSGDVVLLEVFGEHFCKVQCPETKSIWDTMIDRLTKPYTK